MNELALDSTSLRLVRFKKLMQLFFSLRKLVGIPFILLLIITLASIFAPFVSTYPAEQQNLVGRVKPPLTTTKMGFHLAGTDALGRDIFSRLIWGSRVSLLIGATSVLVAGTIGVLLGLLAGFFGGWIDVVIMRWTDLQLAIPFLVLALAVIAVLGSGLLNIILVLGITGWVQYARIVRGETLRVKEEEFVISALAIGASVWRIMFRHVLPNITSSIIVMASLQVARMILMEASLSFLGLGVPVEIPTWGSMVADGRDYLSIAWWIATIPGLMIFLTILSINAIGDRLRDLLDPKLMDY